jgi:hypothetical protein
MADDMADHGAVVTMSITKDVIAGLDPAIHHFGKCSRSLMDTRVKPAYDS